MVLPVQVIARKRTFLQVFGRNCIHASYCTSAPILHNFKVSLNHKGGDPRRRMYAATSANTGTEEGKGNEYETLNRT